MIDITFHELKVTIKQQNKTVKNDLSIYYKVLLTWLQGKLTKLGPSN
jgi:hypothetical protein